MPPLVCPWYVSSYIPALKYRWLTRLYDPVFRWTMPESTFRARLLEQADIQGGHCVLDVGCGTATLTLLVKQACPTCVIAGIDGDPKVLDLARKKAADAGLPVAFDQGMADALPYADGSFDRVLSSLMFHHLVRDDKVRVLREALRVLRPGGELHLADWGKGCVKKALKNPDQTLAKAEELKAKTAGAPAK